MNVDILKNIIDRVRSLPRSYRIGVKCVISAALLWSVLRSVSFDDLGATFATVALLPLVAAFALKYVNMIIMTGKWSILLPEHPRFSSLVLLYWASDFMGLFFLGILGTELFKGMVAQRKPQVVASSLFDRALACIMYALICGIVTTALLIPSFGLQALGFASSIVVYAVVLWLLLRGASAATAWYGKRLTLSLLLSHGLLSTISILVTSVSQWFIFSSIGVSISWPGLLLFSVVLILALALPITVQGIGVREWVYVTAAPFLFISPAVALSAAWLHYLLDLLYKTSGAFPYLARHHRL